MAYIYKITNDINQKVYIGKTEFSIEKRFKEHCKDCQKSSEEKRPLYAAMRKYGIEHFHIELIEETNNPNEREQYWIEQYNSYHHGYNATYGGDGSKLIDYDKVIDTYTQLKSVIKTAQQLNISKEQTSKILHLYNIDIVPATEVNRTQNSKITYMYNLKNEFIMSFPSALAAANYLIEHNLSHCKPTTIRTHISEVCRGKRQTAAGFKWRFAE